MTTRYLPRLLDAVAQRQRQIQHQFLFVGAAGLGAIVDAAMPGIDHHHGSRIRGCGGLGCGARLDRDGRHRGVRDRGLQLGPAFGAKRLNEGGAIDLFQFEHQPRRLAVGGLQHVGICDFGRTGQIEHDPRAAGHDEAIAKRLDQPASGGARAGLQLKVDLGNVHDHPVGIGQRERRETGSACRDRERNGSAWHRRPAAPRRRPESSMPRPDSAPHSRPRGRGWRGTQQCCGAQQRPAREKTMICAARQRIRASERPLTAIEPQG